MYSTATWFISRIQELKDFKIRPVAVKVLLTMVHSPAALLLQKVQLLIKPSIKVYLAESSGELYGHKITLSHAKAKTKENSLELH